MTANGTRRTRSFYLIALALSAAITSQLTACSSCKKGDDTRTGPLTKGAAIAIPAARAAYVTNNGSDSITVFDRDGDTTIHVPVDLEADEHEAPHHLAIDSTAQRMFVALAFPPAPAKATKKDPHASHGGGTDVGRLVRMNLGDLAVTDEVDVDENPGDVVLTHDRARVIVTHFDMRRAMDVAARGAASPATMFAHLVLVDAKTMKRLDSRAVCTAPHGVAITRDDRTAFVACYGSDELAVVDLAAPGLPTSRIPLGSAPGVPGVPRYGPYSATLSPDESYVVLADLEGQDVRVYDRATKKLVPERTVPLAAKAFMPAFIDDKTIIVPTQAPDGIAKVDMASAKVVGRGAITKAECALPHVVKVAKDGRVFLVCEGDHTAPGSVVELDHETLAIKKRWQVGVYPDGIALPED